LGELLKRRRTESTEKIQSLRTKLAEAEKVCRDVACVYVTGSFGRVEASKFSDLDLFILGDCSDAEKRLLSNLDEIVVKADLIQASRELKFPEFSGDGEYLAHHTVLELKKSLGKQDDDVTNRFTARLLLLLESAPLLGESMYHKLTENVVSAYWRDYEDHKNDFMPAFLANDILRMWRTFCVNYEARTKTEPSPEKAKRRLKNYKLKHSRLLTCYSALLFLAAIYSEKKTVSPQDAINMISLTPTMRIEWLLSQERLERAHDALRKVMQSYEEFLKSTEVAEDELLKVFMDSKASKQFMDSAYKFGDLVFDLLGVIGDGNRFHRLLVV